MAHERRPDLDPRATSRSCRSRAASAWCIPSGTWLVVQQTLGGQFTAMTDRGGLVRVDGKDADALGPEFEAEAATPRRSAGRRGRGPVRRGEGLGRARTVYDPEIPASIVELGLVYLVVAGAGRGRPQGAREDDAHRARAAASARCSSTTCAARCSACPA